MFDMCVVTGNAWVVRTPFRGGPVRANLLVRVDCQAYRPTHFTIWLYSYGRSGTLTVSAHKNTTLTPTTPDERSQSCKPVQVSERQRNTTDPFPLKPFICNLHHLKTRTSTLLRPTPHSGTHFIFLFFLQGKYFRLFGEESIAIQRMFWYLYSTESRKTASGIFGQWDAIKRLSGLQCLQKLYH